MTNSAIRGWRASRRSIVIFLDETYAAEARRCGITDAIHMEVDVAPDDIEAETRNVEDLDVSLRACCVARSAHAGQRMRAFPPFASVSSPIRS